MSCLRTGATRSFLVLQGGRSEGGNASFSGIERIDQSEEFFAVNLFLTTRQ